MKEYLSEVKDVLKEQNSQVEGLSSAEAAERLQKYGANKLAEGKKESIFVKFLKELADPMIIILLVAAVISSITEYIEAIDHGVAFFPTDACIILVVVLINAILGVYQESKAEKAIEALQEMAAATSKVIRDGVQIVVKSEELVPGDIVILEAGDAVPADCRIIDCFSMKAEEAALTGESVPVIKTSDVIAPKEGNDVPLGDRKNMVYMGSTIVYGRGTVVVVATGMNTEMGNIAGALAAAKEGDTPLQIKLNQLSKVLTILVVAISAVIFGVGVLRGIGNGFAFKDDILPSFMTAISLAVAAIPEGLAAVVTIVLSMGVTKMSKRNAVIRKLTAVETLGCTQVICSDKTGTLTQNKMTVVEDYGSDREKLAVSFCLCTDAKLPVGELISIGDPTQTAVVDYAAKLGLPKYELEEKEPRVGEIPFDSGRKLMTTVHKSVEGGFIQHTTGAPDVVLGRCTHILRDGKVIELTDAIRAEVSAANKGLADKALRVLAAAYKTHESAPESYEEPAKIESDLIFLGLVGMIDPVRPEVTLAIEECRRAGIRPIMITGDHRDTAAAIARQLGILGEGQLAITGAMLDDISDEDLVRDIEKYSVYARVQPEHKTRIVNAWREKGYVTAMTGDGVNDAPSIKSADIGVGMGITGTDVTKNVADMVLADDNFATIVAAVEEGRKIYSNIRKAIQFLLSSNMSEVITIFTASMIGFTILEAPHLLWINLITDCFPALALGVEPGEKDIMTKPPRSSKEGIFSNGLGFDMVYQGVMVSVLTLAAYFMGSLMDPDITDWYFGINSAHGITMAFLTMSMAEIFHSLNMRSQRGSIFTLNSKNMLLFGAMALAFILTTLVIEVPFLADLFGFTVIGITEYLIGMGLAVLVIPVVEIIKLIQRSVSIAKKN
ncbi:MAG: cation-translocating P-type ATPase [Clostridia bacterium]|nr:cation-translocating P-type ATPase [Clostridia bacterium]